MFLTDPFTTVTFYLPSIAVAELLLVTKTHADLDIPKPGNLYSKYCIREFRFHYL